jgi:mannan endo-1,4-beta-mannosidase
MTHNTPTDNPGSVSNGRTEADTTEGQIGAGGPDLSRRAILRATGVGVGGLVLGAASSSAAARGAWFGDGVNLQPSYFCSGDQEMGWGLMNQYPDISTVRIEIEPPSWGAGQASLSDAQRWIDEANANGYHVIATCHHYPNNGSGDPQDLYDAANWWANNYSYLSANSSFTINLHNEWGSHDTTASTYARAYNNALDTVRNNTSYSGPIVCDLPGYGQETHVAVDASSQINDDIIFSAHIYSSGWNSVENDWLDTGDLDHLNSNTNYPCMVGEFGSKMDGDANWSVLVDHAKSLGWPVLGWAWNGDGGGMNMESPYWGDNCGATSYWTSGYFDTVYNKLGGGSGSGGGGSGGSGSGGGGSGGSGSGGGGGSGSTQYLNAEYYSLDGVTRSTSRSGYWGDGYVTGFHDTSDSVTMNVDLSAGGNRPVTIRYASEFSDKNCNLSINGSQVAQPTLPQSGSFRETSAGTHYFNQGYNEITIEKGWGWYDIDCVIIE